MSIKIDLSQSVPVATPRVPAREINPLDFPIIVQWYRGERRDNKFPVGTVHVGTPLGMVSLSFFERNGQYSLSNDLSFCKLQIPRDLQTNILEEIERQASNGLEATITHYEFVAMPNGGGILGRLNITTREFGKLWGILVKRTKDGRVYITEPTNYLEKPRTVDVKAGETYYPQFTVGNVKVVDGVAKVEQSKNPLGGVTLSRAATQTILEIAQGIVSGELTPTVTVSASASVAAETAIAEDTGVRV